MTVPAEEQLVTVTGTYVDFLGNPAVGWIDFVSQSPVEQDATSSRMLVPQRVRVTLDATGSFSVALPSTDSAMLPAGWLWQATETFPGGRTYLFALPRAAGPSQRITSLAPVPVGS